MIKVYIKPFLDSGEYGDFIDITEDVEKSSIGTFTESIMFNDYGTGQIKISDMSLTVTNRNGLYSQETEANSIFRYKRSDSIVKVTHSFNSIDNICGFTHYGSMALAGDTETTVFEGLLNDEATTESAERQTIKFKVLSFDDVLKRTELPSGTISNGQTTENAIYSILNLAPFNELVTVSLSNIDCPVNETIDDATAFDDQDVKQALDQLLGTSNAVMVIKDNTVFISSRVPSNTSSYTFRGQASEIGEDIQKISEAKNGLNRVFNYIAWEDTTLFKQETSSIDKYLRKRKDIEFACLTSQAKRENVLQNILDTFSLPKREFDLTAPILPTIIELKLLDKVNVDYPTPLYAPLDGVLPIYGIAVYGTDQYPYADYTITIDESVEWQIITRKVSFKSNTITFKLREV